MKKLIKELMVISAIVIGVASAFGLYNRSTIPETVAVDTIEWDNGVTTDGGKFLPGIISNVARSVMLEYFSEGWSIEDRVFWKTASGVVNGGETLLICYVGQTKWLLHPDSPTCCGVPLTISPIPGS